MTTTELVDERVDSVTSRSTRGPRQGIDPFKPRRNGTRPAESQTLRRVDPFASTNEDCPFVDDMAPVYFAPPSNAAPAPAAAPTKAAAISKAPGPAVTPPPTPATASPSASTVTAAPTQAPAKTPKGAPAKAPTARTAPNVERRTVPSVKAKTRSTPAIPKSLSRTSQRPLLPARTPQRRLPTSISRLRQLRAPEGFYRSGHFVVWIVAFVYYSASVYIFRDVIRAIPSVLRGDAVIGGDELVPFFNVHSQLLDQAAGKYSELTNGYEFRVRYSFLTTWMRYYAVLPFAIVIVIPSVAYAAYRNIAWFIRSTIPSLDSTSVYVATAFPVGLAYMIMTYAKITHFYTLVVGLMMFTVATTTMLYGVIFKRKKWVRYIAAGCFVTLLNPAVHYLILFALVVQITVFTLLVGEFSRWLRRRQFGHVLTAPARIRGRWRKGKRLRSAWIWWRWWINKTTVGRCAVAMVLLVAVAIVPYGLFVKFIALRGVENLAETVPSDYYFIRDASVSWLHVLSWDLAGIMDKILYGDYLSRTPRFPNIVYSMLLLVPFFVPPVRNGIFIHRSQRQLFGVFAVLISFATWATIGYAEPEWFPTFHRTMAAVTRTMYSTGTPVGDLTLSLSSTIVQVLRFPHRFQLILFVVGPIVMTVALASIIGGLRRLVVPEWLYLRGRRERREGGIVVLLLGISVGAGFYLPFFSNQPYRNVFGSGDFGQFLAPYPLEDLRDLRDALDELPTGKTVVLPPTETSKLVIDANGVPHKFIDKFYMYYLDKPSFYYGLTGDSGNKFEFFLILRAMYYQQDWWINVARDIGLQYIVVDRSITDNRGIGAEYLPNVEDFVEPRVAALPDQVELRHENDSFALYEIVDQAKPERDVLLIDTSWNGFLDLVYERLELSKCYDLQYMPLIDEIPTDQKVFIVSDDPGHGALDVWARQHPEAIIPPSSKMFAFDPNIVSSNYYLSPMFRLFLFFSNTKWNRTETITPGIFGTLNGSFIGIPRATNFVANVTIPDDGRYRLLLRGASTVNDVSVRSPDLGIDNELELVAPRNALGLVEEDSVYSQERVVYDVTGHRAEELEPLIGDGLVAVNYRYRYIDLGVVDATQGIHPVVFEKHDDNPMLVESVLVVPESEFATMTYPAGVTPIDSLADLDCGERSPVVGERVNYVDPAANGEHAYLSQEELIDLAASGVNQLEPDESGGLSGEFQTLVMVGMIIAGCSTFVFWRSRQWHLEEAKQASRKLSKTNPSQRMEP